MKNDKSIDNLTRTALLDEATHLLQTGSFGRLSFQLLANKVGIKKGSNLYRGHCGACHGSQAEGNPALNAPGLAWLDVAYMARQYRNFQQGLRGRHPDDTYGRQMQAIASNPLTEQDLNNVIAYMRTLATE